MRKEMDKLLDYMKKNENSMNVETLDTYIISNFSIRATDAQKFNEDTPYEGHVTTMYLDNGYHFDKMDYNEITSNGTYKSHNIKLVSPDDKGSVELIDQDVEDNHELKEYAKTNLIINNPVELKKLNKMIKETDAQVKQKETRKKALKKRRANSQCLQR